MNSQQVTEQLKFLHAEYVQKEQELLDKLSREEREKLGHPIKDIHLLDKFTANGTEYTVGTSLGIERFMKFEELQVPVGYGVSIRDMFGNLRKAYDHLNESRPADGAVILYNLLSGMKDHIDGRENEILSICALFIHYEGEDLSTFSKDVLDKKIADWKAENISMDSFFDFAFNLVTSFTPVYKETSLSISEHVNEVRRQVMGQSSE